MIQFKKLPFKIEQVYLTSDTHYSHNNICRGISKWNSNECRDFDTLEEMNNTIVNNINKYVKYDDLLIHCGDWSFGGIENIKKFRDRINCKNIILIQGNHDHNIDKHVENGTINELFLEFKQIGYYQIEFMKFVCCHFPMSIWHQSHKDVPLFYGHVHGSFQNVGKSMDVGIDNIFKLIDIYKPISLEAAFNICMSRETFLESHHQKNTN
jgi:calcineurin-like phosphoesterase family protein